MRESRTYGSMRGAGSNLRPYRDRRPHLERQLSEDELPPPVPRSAAPRCGCGRYVRSRSAFFRPTMETHVMIAVEIMEATLVYSRRLFEQPIAAQREGVRG